MLHLLESRLETPWLTRGRSRPRNRQHLLWHLPHLPRRRRPLLRSEVRSRLSGTIAGRELELTKPLTTLGKPGVQVAVLTRRPQGFFVTHVEGASFPVVNGKTLDAQAQMLNDHDIIELAGVKMEFFYKT